jgi:hypothetical protein
MGGVLEWIQADAADPLGDKTSILARRQMSIGSATAWEQALAKLSAPDPKVVVQRLLRHLGQLEANWPTGLALPDIGAVDRVAVGRHIIDLESNEIAAAQLAVDGEIEERQVPHAPLQLQSGTDGPDMANPQWWLRAPELAFGAGRTASTSV